MSERTAPQLLFDDGSRVIQEQSAAAGPIESIRGSIPIETYYEIDRLASEIVQIVQKSNNKKKESEDDTWFARVALQFPDELLSDSPEVCWAMEEALERMQETADDKKSALVFCLGDTTFGPCCPDEVAALHLKADVLVHYGHACLSHPPLALPVLYSFGVSDHWDTPTCVDAILEQAKSNGATRRLLLLYQVKYQHAMEDLQTQLSERGDILLVVGEIPQYSEQEMTTNPIRQGCCSSDSGTCSATENPNQSSKIDTTTCEEQIVTEVPTTSTRSGEETFLVGGLEVPKNLDFSSFTLVFIGDHQGQSEGLRQYMNTVLWYLSAKSKPADFWVYSPLQKTLETSIPPGIQRQLNRRFYLIQKARDASIYGILIGTLSQRYFRSVVDALRNVIEEKGRTQYTFAMGKVNPAKIANFAEIECFIMVACAETSWLAEEEQREMHVPIITPLELHMALGSGGPEVQWGECDYSLDYTDFLLKYEDRAEAENPGNNGGGKEQSPKNGDDCTGEDDEEDAPYFSLITGKYESGKKGTAEGIDLKALPGKGQLTTYKSEAAEFLKKREYRGLETQIGETEVRAAIPGQQGIASKYNNDLETSSGKRMESQE